MSGYTTLLTALGWSLLNSIWQMSVVWIFYYLLTAGNKRISAAAKHDLALLFVAIGSGWMVSSFIQLLNNPAHTIVTGYIPLIPHANRWIPFVSCLYLMILFARFLQYGFQYFESGNNKSGKSSSPLIQSLVDRQARLLGISKRVQVYLSDLAETAETSGLLKPLILLPVTLITRLSPEQIEAILVHELFHIRRNDYLINICMSCFRCIFFFNPFAHLFYNEISRERENACDDEVIERGYEPSIYAEALFCLEKYRQVHPGFSIAADGNAPWLLMERIRRVLGKPSLKKDRFSPIIFFSVVVSIGLSGLQQKTPVPGVNTMGPVKNIPAIYAGYQLANIRELSPAREIKSNPVVPHKPVRKKNITPVMPVITMEDESSDETDFPEKAFFADNVLARNFSNEQASGPNESSIPSAPGTPYVPSESLSYEDIPDLTQADSIRDIAIQNRIKEMFSQSRLTAIDNLKELQKEEAKNSQELKKLQLKNHQLILLHQRNIKPLLDNIQQQLQIRKQKIDHLKIRLQITDEEIIHI